jgi:hypothetical protein
MHLHEFIVIQDDPLHLKAVLNNVLSKLNGSAFRNNELKNFYEMIMWYQFRLKKVRNL